MSTTRFVSLAAALTLVLTGACGGDAPRVAAPAPSVMRIGGGNNQYWIAGLKLPASLAVVLESAGGDPLANVSVLWKVTSGGGTVGGEDAPNHGVSGYLISIPSNQNGISQVIWVLGPTLGPQSLTASVTGFLGSPATFSATATSQ